MMDITQQEFEQLPKEQQNFRWALFIISNGYTKVIPFEKIIELHKKYLIRKEKLDKKMFG